MERSSYVRRRKTKTCDRVDLSSLPISTVTPSWEDLVRTRCSIRWYLKAIKDVSVRDVHARRLEATPFSKVIHVANVEIIPRLLDELIGRYEGDNIFDLAGVKVKFSTLECSAFLGLPASGYPIQLDGRVRRVKWFEEKLFGLDSCVDMSKEFFLKKMKVLRDSDQADDVEMFCTAWILLMFSSFLLPTSSYTCQKQLLPYVAHLDNLKYYNWGGAVHEYMMDNIHDIAEKIKTRDRSGSSCKAGYLVGCTPVLMVWLYEHTYLCSPTFHSTSFRLQKWASRGKDEERRTICSLEKDEVIVDVKISESEKAMVYPLMEEFPDLDDPSREIDVPCGTKDQSQPEGTSSNFLVLENERLQKRIVELEGLLAKKNEDEQEVKVDEAHELQQFFHGSALKREGKGMRSRRVARKKRSKPASKREVDEEQEDIEEREDDEEREVDKEREDIEEREDDEEREERVIYRSSTGNFCTAEQLENARRDGLIVDDVLDAYLDLLMKENQAKKSRHKCGYLSVYAHNKFNDDPATASQEDLQQFQKFVHGVDILKLSFYFMVVCCDAHWLLVVMDVSRKCFKTYNSRTGHRRDDAAVKTLVGWMKRYMSDILLVANVQSWKIEKMADIPIQAANSLDCAIFTLQYAEHLSRRLKMKFTQSSMPNLREMIINRIYEAGDNQRLGGSFC